MGGGRRVLRTCRPLLAPLADVLRLARFWEAGTLSSDFFCCFPRYRAFQRPRNLCSHPSAGNTKSLARLLRANNPLVSIDFPSILME